VCGLCVCVCLYIGEMAVWIRESCVLKVVSYGREGRQSAIVIEEYVVRGTVCAHGIHTYTHRYTYRCAHGTHTYTHTYTHRS
jgi:hypothetical protein